jgi:hypothetical protein
MGFLDTLRREYRRGKDSVEQQHDRRAEHDSNQQSFTVTIPDDANPFVTPQRVQKMSDTLFADEPVYHLLTGAKVKASEQSVKQGTSGYVRVAATDTRLAISIPQFRGSDTRSIPYTSVTSIDLDTGMALKRLRIQTMGETYTVSLKNGSPRKAACREMVEFVTKRLIEVQQ